MKTTKRSQVARLYKSILTEIGAMSEPAFLDVVNTPNRVARMLTDELLVGYKKTEAHLVKELRMFPSAGTREMVVQTDIPFCSVCAHHMLPFAGTMAIGYLPGKYLLGLSKFSRIVDYYSARLQIQERLGAQVADFMMSAIGAEAAFVLLKAEHYCMKCRGVKKHGVQTVTSSVRPQPPDQQLLSEFLALVEHGQR